MISNLSKTPAVVSLSLFVRRVRCMRDGWFCSERCSTDLGDNEFIADSTNPNHQLALVDQFAFVFALERHDAHEIYRQNGFRFLSVPGQGSFIIWDPGVFASVLRAALRTTELLRGSKYP